MVRQSSAQHHSARACGLATDPRQLMPFSAAGYSVNRAIGLELGRRLPLLLRALRWGNCRQPLLSWAAIAVMADRPAIATPRKFICSLP